VQIVSIVSGKGNEGGRGRSTSLRIQPSQMKTVFVGWVVHTTLASRCNIFSVSKSFGISGISCAVVISTFKVIETKFLFGYAVGWKFEVIVCILDKIIRSVM